MPKTKPIDAYRDAYDQWFQKNIDLYQAELKAFFRLMPPIETILDGFGKGAFVVIKGVAG